MMTRADLETIAVRWVLAGWQRGDTAAVRAMYAEDFVDLSSPAAQRGARDDNLAGIVELYAAFPDFYATIDDLVVDPDQGKIAVRWSASGTHQGTYFGIAPTGRHIQFRGIETLRVERGLIVERAGEWDGIEILRQLGALL
jgi:steroid delta-isomerase-like uncharacterized protein